MPAKETNIFTLIVLISYILLINLSLEQVFSRINILSLNRDAGTDEISPILLESYTYIYTRYPIDLLRPII